VQATFCLSFKNIDVSVVFFEDTLPPYRNETQASACVADTNEATINASELLNGGVKLLLDMLEKMCPAKQVSCSSV
jgi:hypothetical protein